MDPKTLEIRRSLAQKLREEVVGHDWSFKLKFLFPLFQNRCCLIKVFFMSSVRNLLWYYRYTFIYIACSVLVLVKFALVSYMMELSFGWSRDYWRTLKLDFVSKICPFSAWKSLLCPVGSHWCILLLGLYVCISRLQPWFVKVYVYNLHFCISSKSYLHHFESSIIKVCWHPLRLQRRNENLQHPETNSPVLLRVESSVRTSSYEYSFSFDPIPPTILVTLTKAVGPGALRDFSICFKYKPAVFLILEVSVIDGGSPLTEALHCSTTVLELPPEILFSCSQQFS